MLTRSNSRPLARSPGPPHICPGEYVVLTSFPQIKARVKVRVPRRSLELETLEDRLVLSGSSLSPLLALPAVSERPAFHASGPADVQVAPGHAEQFRPSLDL